MYVIGSSTKLIPWVLRIHVMMVRRRAVGNSCPGQPCHPPRACRPPGAPTAPSFEPCNADFGSDQRPATSGQCLADHVRTAEGDIPSTGLASPDGAAISPFCCFCGLPWRIDSAFESGAFCKDANRA
jgi:hypothetical protein